MGSGRSWSTRALVAAVAVVVLSGVTAVASTPAAWSASDAAAQAGDTAVARSGTFVASDLPDGFGASAPSDTTHADNLRLAKVVDGCAPYVALQKAVAPLPQAKSPRFADATRGIGNEVDVFPTERAAAAALVLYAKPSVVGCLENLFEKQTRQDPSLRASLDDVVVTLDRQDIAGLGDDSVVYEGTLVLTGTNGSKNQVGIGRAAVRVGRAVDLVTYSSTGGTLTDVLTPAIDSSVARLRTALARTGS